MRCFLLLSGLVSLISAMSGPDHRIVGGSSVEIGEFPYQVSLQHNDGEHICGGVIIKSNWILTAAHCVTVGEGREPYPVRNYQVRSGSIQRQSGGQLTKLKRIVVHKHYSNNLNDLALLELQVPLTLNDYTKTVELSASNVVEGTHLYVAGWGQSSNGIVPHRLQKHQFESISNVDCEKNIYYEHESLLCLKHDIGQGICIGDAGSGAVNAEGKLVGLAAFVVGDCGAEYADGFTNIYYHRQWISENVN